MKLEDVKELILMMVENRIDILELDGLKLVKTRYEIDVSAPPASNKTKEEIEDDLLFYSTR